MKRVYIASNLIGAQMMKDYLISFGIDAFVQGDLLTGAVGELPADSGPSVWVFNDDDLDRAEEQVKIYEAQQPEDQVYNNVWKCIKCDELIDAQFTQCWQCGSERNV